MIVHIAKLTVLVVLVLFVGKSQQAGADGCNVNGKKVNFGETFVTGLYRFRCTKQSTGWISKPEACNWQQPSGADVWITCNNQHTIGGHTATCRCQGNFINMERPWLDGCNILGKIVSYNDTYLSQGMFRSRCLPLPNGGWTTQIEDCKWERRNGAVIWVKCNIPQTSNGFIANCSCHGGYARFKASYVACVVDGKLVNFGNTYLTRDGMFRFRCKKLSNGYETEAEACNWKQPNGADVWVNCNDQRTIDATVGECKCPGGNAKFGTRFLGCFIKGRTYRWGETFVQNDLYRYRCKRIPRGWKPEPVACKWKQPGGTDVWVNCNGQRTMHGRTAYCNCNGRQMSFQTTCSGCYNPG